MYTRANAQITPDQQWKWNDLVIQDILSLRSMTFRSTIPGHRPESILRRTILLDLVNELEILEHVFLCSSVYMNSSVKTRGILSRGQ